MQRPALPAVHNAKWAANPIDRFILARLEKEELTPSPEADRVTLLRRLSQLTVGSLQHGHMGHQPIGKSTQSAAGALFLSGGLFQFQRVGFTLGNKGYERG